MQNRFKSDYDREEDMLFLYDSAKKSSGSIEFGDLVVDFDRGGAVSAVEIFNASGYLSKLTGLRITKASLGSASGISFSATEMKGTVIIKMILLLKGKEVPASIAVPSAAYHSPALAYAG